jgi:uncharacterized hydrophobic protein (TIGR00271 family)
LTLLAPPDLAPGVAEALARLEGVHGVVRVPGAGVPNGEDLIACAVEPEVADGVLERLRAARVPAECVTLSRRGVDLTEIGGDEAGLGLWDESADVVVWDEVLEDAADDSRLSFTYLVIMAVAGLIASLGVYDDQPVLIVGAMALSPDLMPLSALSVGLVARAFGVAARGAATLLLGLAAAATLAALTIAIASGYGHRPAGGGFGRGVLTTFITNPGLSGAVVALAGGVAAMLSFERRSAGSVVGVAISVTTIPAAAGLGIAVGLADLDRALGALAVLAINLSCLATGAVATAWVQRRLGRPTVAVPAGRRVASLPRFSSRRRPPRGPIRSR